MRSLLMLLLLAAMPARVFAQCPDGTPPPCGPAQLRLPRIQVLGFSAGSGDTSLTYVADALTDDVVASLRSARGVVVLSARAARGAADYQLFGRVGGTGTGVTVSARLEHADGRVAWTATRERMRRDLPATAGELSRELLRSIGQPAGTAPSQRPMDPQVYDLVLRGRYQLVRRTPAGVARSQELFRQAIALDSTAALSWAWYARALFYARRWAFPTPGVAPESTLAVELAAADRAVELDPSNPAVWTMRAQVAADITPTSRTAAIAAVRRSLALDSGQADPWRLLGQMLEEIGDSAGAVQAERRAVAIAPDDAEWLSTLSLHYVWSRDYVTALRWADSAVTVDPMLVYAHAVAAQAAFWAGHLADAEAHVASMSRLSPAPDLIGGAIDVRAPLARGDSGSAWAALAATRQRAGASPSLHAALAIADGLTALGDTAEALQALERFPVRGDMHFQMHLRLERGFDALRASPRFRQLLVAPQN